MLIQHYPSIQLKFIARLLYTTTTIIIVTKKTKRTILALRTDAYKFIN